MALAASVLTVIVALLHVAFFVLESVLWTTPNVRKRFGMSEQEAEATKVLASNQGVYNLGLAMGLIVALGLGEPVLQGFLLAYIAVMGLYGAATAKGSILFIQTVPAAAALVVLWLA